MYQFGDSHWLTDWEQRDTIKELLRYELIRWDNGRNLPLANGGSTDIYLNERDARNTPEAMLYLAQIYANPLSRLKIQRFGEIPDSVSCFAGLVSVLSGIPYCTIRKTPKEGRVSNANLIGKIIPGERFALIDDVITDGKSKEAPYWLCKAYGVEPSLIVLVDRQQGWSENFSKQGINLPLWSGMTLHDVRKYLINEGLMARCDNAMEAKNPLVLALDGKSWEEILPLIDILRPTGCILKVNDLFWAKGADLIDDLNVYGRVLVDLKGHDIPNTIDNDCQRLTKKRPWGVTMHASGGKAMLQEAVKILRPFGIKVLAVTVLTSMDDDNCLAVYHKHAAEQVKDLALIANEADVDGFVCSALEVRELKAAYPGRLFLTPGLRSPGADSNDQARIDTPANALANGSTGLIIGRQIIGAKDPVAEVYRLLYEELKINR